MNAMHRSLLLQHHPWSLSERLCARFSCRVGSPPADGSGEANDALDGALACGSGSTGGLKTPGVKRHSVLRQNTLQQSRKALFQFCRTQGIHVRGADSAGVYKACVAQDAEVVRHAGFGPATVQFPTGRFVQPCQAADDFETYRVAQRVQETFEREIGGHGMFMGAHRADDNEDYLRTLYFEYYRTSEKNTYEVTSQCQHCSSRSP